MKYTLLKFAAYAGILLLVSISACKRKVNMSDIVQNWEGKKIVFPTSSECLMLGEYSPCKFTTIKPYKILLYTDSTGCTSCKLRLDMWKDLMKEADTTLHGKVEFLFYFYPKNKTVLHDLMKQENFREQVYVDRNDELNQINKFPTQMEFQCFLLDSTNQVVSVGNPTFNTKIWDLDKKIINGTIKPSSD